MSWRPTSANGSPPSRSPHHGYPPSSSPESRAASRFHGGRQAINASQYSIYRPGYPPHHGHHLPPGPHPPRYSESPPGAFHDRHRLSYPPTPSYGGGPRPPHGSRPFPSPGRPVQPAERRGSPVRDGPPTPAPSPPPQDMVKSGGCTCKKSRYVFLGR